LSRGTATGRTSFRCVASIASSGPTSAEVDFDLTVHGHPSGSFVERYVGDAVAQGGTWLVSWSTACFLIESQNELCPKSPVGLASPLPLPTDLSEGSSGTPDTGLVDPEALAVEGDGSLLIVDQSFLDRDGRALLYWQYT
jgi:hypothetical protein